MQWAVGNRKQMVSSSLPRTPPRDHTLTSEGATHLIRCDLSESAWVSGLSITAEVLLVTLCWHHTDPFSALRIKHTELRAPSTLYFCARRGHHEPSDTSCCQLPVRAATWPSLGGVSLPLSIKTLRGGDRSRAGLGRGEGHANTQGQEDREAATWLFFFLFF